MRLLPQLAIIIAFVSSPALAGPLFYSLESEFSSNSSGSLSFESFEVPFNQTRNGSVFFQGFSASTNDGILFHRAGGPNSFHVSDGDSGLGHYNNPGSLLTLSFENPINALSLFFSNRSLSNMSLHKGSDSVEMRSAELVPVFFGLISEEFFTTFTISLDNLVTANTSNISNRNYYIDGLSFGEVDTSSISFPPLAESYLVGIPIRERPSTPQPSNPGASNVTEPNVLAIFIMALLLLHMRNPAKFYQLSRGKYRTKLT